MSRYESMNGIKSLLPAKEILTSERGTDGLWHAHYPTGQKTLCGRVLQPIRKGRKGKPNCVVCRRVALEFDRIDGSCPAHWPRYAVVKPFGVAA